MNEERVEIIINDPAVNLGSGVTPEIEIAEQFIPDDNINHLNFSLTEYGARIEDPSTNNTKNISLQTLARVILDDAMLDTGFLPVYGKDYIAIKRYLQLKNKHLVFIEASANVRTANYFPSRADEPTPYEIPHPSILMAIKLEDTPDGKMRVVDSRVYCMKTTLATEDTQLYKFPFGNVYTTDRGRICWGGYDREVREKRYKNIMQAGELVNLFLSTGYNNDLFNPDAIPTNVESNKEVFEYLVGKEYPRDTLKEDIKFTELLSLLSNN